jgi:hypothetical protein
VLSKSERVGWPVPTPNPGVTEKFIAGVIVGTFSLGLRES